METEMAYRIRMNEHHGGNNDSEIRKIGGVYRSLEQAIKQAGTLQSSNFPDGTIGLYDKDVTKEEIKADTTGQCAVATIELVR
jgi:hypothetical protein